MESHLAEQWHGEPSGWTVAWRAICLIIILPTIGNCFNFKSQDHFHVAFGVNISSTSINPKRRPIPSINECCPCSVLPYHLLASRSHHTDMRIWNSIYSYFVWLCCGPRWNHLSSVNIIIRWPTLFSKIQWPNINRWVLRLSASSWQRCSLCGVIFVSFRRMLLVVVLTLLSSSIIFPDRLQSIFFYWSLVVPADSPRVYFCGL